MEAWNIMNNNNFIYLDIKYNFNQTKSLDNLFLSFHNLILPFELGLINLLSHFFWVKKIRNPNWHFLTLIVPLNPMET